MIATVVNVDELKVSMIIIVIERENLERMEGRDPVTLETQKSGGCLPAVKYPDKLQILLAYEEDEEQLHQVINSGKGLFGLVEYLRRGYRFKPGIDGTSLAVSLSNPPKES